MSTQQYCTQSNGFDNNRPQPNISLWYLRPHSQICSMTAAIAVILRWILTITVPSSRSLHSPPFSGQTLGRLRRTQPIQNAKFLALELLELSSDFLVTFWCMLTGLVESDGLSGGLTAGISPNQLSYSTGNDRTAAESPTEVQQKSGGLQQTPSRQLSLLVLLIKNEN